MKNKAGFRNSNFLKTLIRINLVMLSACSFSSIVMANEAPCPPCDYFVVPVSPYVGINGGIRHMSWPNNFGGNLYKREYPEADFYLGAKFNDYWGLQAGYKTTTKRAITPSVGVGDTALGNPVLNQQNHITHAQFKGWHGELVGYLPSCLLDCVYLFGTIGFTNYRLYQTDDIRENNFVPFRAGVFGVTFKKTKTILSLGTGLEFKLDNRLSLRANFGWDNTARFKSLTATDSSLFTSHLQLKNSYSYGVGIILRVF